MSSRQSFSRKDGAPRRRKQLVIKEKNIVSDEFMAASIGDVEWLDQSLRDGRNPSTFDKNGLAPIHLAALHGRLNCLQLLIEKYEVDVNLSSTTGWNPIHLCINKDTGPRALKCLNYLLEKDADAECLNDDNVTPAHQAAGEGLLDCVKRLIEVEVDLHVKDVRGHQAIDLARLWGHKHCGRVIRAEMWKKKKTQKAEELKQLQVVKHFYGELQKEAVLQLRNEQEFYGGVAFGNWLADKNLPESLKEMSTFPRERYPDESTDGLAKRLRTSGGLDDCAERLEKNTLKKEKRPVKTSKATFLSKPNSKPASKVTSTKVQESDVRRKTERIERKSNLYPTKQVERVGKMAHDDMTYSHQVTWEEEKTAVTPFSELTGVTGASRNRYYGKLPWNYSTNPDRDPVTDIKYKDTVSMSIHPDEPDRVLPKHANLSVKLDMSRRPKIKVTVPGGRLESADIRMPHLPPHLIHEVLSGINSDRIRIPQEFKAVHVYDIKKKKQPLSKPKDEVGMHLSLLGDPRILQKSMSSISSNTRSPLRTLSRPNCLPEISEKKFERMLETLHRIHPPKTFLA